MRFTRLISGLAAASLLIAFTAAPASADASPTVSATPNKKLADGQQISVSATGFTADALIAVVECPTTTVSPDACDLNTVNFATADGSGAFSDFAFTVSRILSDGTDCALVGGCYVGVQDANNGGPTAAALLKFDPKIPPLPPLELQVRLDKTGKVNDKGTVAVNGTLHCTNRAAQVDVEVDLRQIVNRAIFESFGDSFVTCDADTTVPFHMTIHPSNGLFGPGAATAHVVADTETVFVEHKVELTLAAK
jgi:Neocarzinostatin family